MILKDPALLAAMIVIELDGYSLNVPVKPRMDIKDFLSLADRLEQLHGAKEQHHEQQVMPAASAPANEDFTFDVDLPKPPRRKDKQANVAENPMEEFRFEDEDQTRLQHAISALQTNQEALMAAQQRIERQEDHIKQILDYLHSLDRHLRK
jgi:hypothetical protein